MKIRHGFVSNSSSTAFIIWNNTGETLTLVDFVRENPQLIQQFLKKYDWHDEAKHNQENLISSAKTNNEDIKPGRNYMRFGDEDGTLIGAVFDYILRGGGKSARFSWKFEESLR